MTGWKDSSRRRIRLAVLLATLALPPSVRAEVVSDDAQAGQENEDQVLADPNDLDSLLELAEEDVGQLARVNVAAPALEMEVSTVSRQVSTVGRSPAAVFVITNEMIRRSGARSIPEVLRLAPGVNVGRINANQWAVSIRGFNGLWANKLLVQIDGRSVYTLTFSGVFWDMQDVLLEDVERIEVIRGPGATVWGANAVNGVINIITKKARDTQGVLAQGGAGSEERGFGSFRYGGSLDESLCYRIYGKGFERDGGFPSGAAGDDWRKGQIGFRADWQPGDCTTLTLQGDYYEGISGIRVNSILPTPPFLQPGTQVDDDISGSNVLLRCSRSLDEQTDWAIQLYYDREARFAGGYGFGYSCDTFDLDFQHRFPLAARHALIWGCGYRDTRNASRGSFGLSLAPPIRSFDLISYFVQDEITLSEDRLYLTVGSKFEHNDFSGFEFQPTARLLWTPSERESVWASISRAVRTPSRTDHNLRVVSFPAAISFAPPGATFGRIEGNPAVESEDVLAYEIGWRAQPHEDFSWDLAVFYNDYDNLVVAVPATPFPPPPTLPPAFWSFVQTNAARAETYGYELAGTWQVGPCWRLQGGYSFLKIHMHARADAAPGAESAEGESPQNTVFLQSGWDLGRCVQLDMTGRYVDSLPALGIPSYIAMDVRLAWLPTDTLEMAVVGRHLLDASHPEFEDRSRFASEVESEAYGMVTYRY